MSIHEIPVSGYVVPVSSLKKLIPEEFHKDFDSLLNSEKNINTEKIENFLYTCLPFPMPEIYLPRDEDTMDGNMEYGIPYAVFSESDLFMYQPKEIYTKLEELDITPVLTSWIIHA